VEIKKLENINATVYEQASSLQNFSFYHNREWHEFLQNTFGWKIHALVSMDEAGRSQLFLPFVSKLRPNLKRNNIALPFSHEIGPAFQKGLKLEKIFQNFPLGNMEVHGTIKSKNFQKAAPNYTTILNLKKYKSFDQYYKTLDYKSIKYPINRAEKNKISISRDFTSENFKIFRELLVHTRKRQGAPMYPAKFFENLCQTFKDTKGVSIYIAFFENSPVSGAIFFNHKDTCIYAYSTSTNEKNLKKLGGNELVMSYAVEDAIKTGKKHFDFGTTPRHLTGLRKFKEKWGGKSTPLYYSFFPKRAKISQVRRDGKLVSIISTILTKMPLPLFKILSPRILKIAI